MEERHGPLPACLLDGHVFRMDLISFGTKILFCGLNDCIAEYLRGSLLDYKFLGDEKP